MVIPLLPSPPKTPAALILDLVTAQNGTILLRAHSAEEPTACPECSYQTNHIHSHYHRTLMDLPWQGQSVCIELTVRKLFCDNIQCPRRIFTERLPQIVCRYARKTERLADALRELAFLTGGEAASRIAKAFGLTISADTFLDILHKSPPSCPSAIPRVLGIDDFAFRKGQRYGTILVDLEKNCPIDVLPDRDAKSVEHWLKQHPGVEIVSRDRAEVYRNGVTAGAPKAIQVADRSHLLANLRQALQDSLIPFRKQFLRTTPIVDSASSNSSTRGSPQSSGLTTRQQRLQAERRQKRHNIWERIQSLRNSGHTQAQIAGEVGVSVKTVRRLFQGNAYPERKARTRSVNELTPFLPYIQEQWNAERRCIATLYREVQDQGFKGSYGAVYGAICRLKKNMALYPDAVSNVSVPVRSPFYSVRQMTWLFLRSVDEGALSAEQLGDLEATLSSDTSLLELRDLAHMLVRLIRQRDVPALGAWISAASDSSFGEMKRLSSGLVSDLAAVRASLEQEWSNGQVEGQVNRLKFVKRSMYGRGSFDLLKARVLHQNKAVA